jgi:hypothetical protein
MIILEHSFSDCAYVGMQPRSTGAVSLAFLGVASDAGYSFSDSAYLGLQPGRATARRSAFIGLFDSDSVAIIKPGYSYEEMWGSGGVSWLPSPRTLVGKYDEDEELALLIPLMMKVIINGNSR